MNELKAQLTYWRSKVSQKLVTEERLKAALERLLAGKPERINNVGKLSLNKINNEAGLGHSYIHKFEDFVRYIAKPAIEAFNANYDPLKTEHKSKKSHGLNDIEILKARIDKEIRLKELYRKERDELKFINKNLEQQNSSLMFRLYELQNELNYNKISKF